MHKKISYTEQKEKINVLVGEQEEFLNEINNIKSEIKDVSEEENVKIKNDKLEDLHFKYNKICDKFERFLIINHKFILSNMDLNDKNNIDLLKSEADVLQMIFECEYNLKTVKNEVKTRQEEISGKDNVLKKTDEKYFDLKSMADVLYSSFENMDNFVNEFSELEAQTKKRTETSITTADRINNAVNKAVHSAVLVGAVAVAGASVGKPGAMAACATIAANSVREISRPLTPTNHEVEEVTYKTKVKTEVNVDFIDNSISKVEEALGSISSLKNKVDEIEMNFSENIEVQEIFEKVDTIEKRLKDTQMQLLTLKANSNKVDYVRENKRALIK